MFPLSRIFQNLKMSGQFIFIRSYRKLSCLLSKQRIAPKLVWKPSVSPHKPVCCRTMSRDSSKEPQNRDESLSTKMKDQQQIHSQGDSSNKMSSRQRLSLVFAEYGVIAVVFHTGISLASLGLCYVAVSR